VDTFLGVSWSTSCSRDLCYSYIESSFARRRRFIISLWIFIES
ncbi:unnamed protein product, partial [Brassica rapa]